MVRRDSSYTCSRLQYCALRGACTDGRAVQTDLSLAFSAANWRLTLLAQGGDDDPLRLALAVGLQLTTVQQTVEPHRSAAHV